MAELLFIATTVFVAYVLFTVIGNDKENPAANSQPAETKPDIAEKVTPPTTAKAAAPEQKTPPPAKPAPKPAAAKPVKATKKPAASKAKEEPVEKAEPPKEANDNLKNPKTGEVAKVPANYAFAKRWIKEALVEEGLLEKVYKNNELDTNTVNKIQAAIQALKAMDKYQ